MKFTLPAVVLIWLLAGCTKSSYTVIPDAAYLRVFNGLNYAVDVTTKDQPLPFLAMVIDPQYDESGLITGGKILGDFLDKRSSYAPPYPANAGNTDYKNTEYPGSAKVLVGPILNGFDLSSWAQVPSGKHRVVFYSRPISPTPFFSLEARDRKSLLADTTFNFSPGEVYTMEALQQVYSTQSILPVNIYLRQEQFTERAFNEATLYVNFYNLSSQGYGAAYGTALNSNAYLNASNKTVGISDTMMLYYSLLKDDMPYPYVDGNKTGTTLIAGYSNVLLGSVVRSQSSGVAPYYGLPMFADVDTTKGILSKEWELFALLAPGTAPLPGLVAISGAQGLVGATNRAIAISCSNVANDGKYSNTAAGRQSVPRSGTSLIASTSLPNLIKYTASGNYKQRSFATISSIEIINGQVYLMSVQRSYPPPSF